MDKKDGRSPMPDQLWRREVPEAERATVLIVDDEPLTLETLRRQLSRDYRVLAATDGPSCLGQLAAHEEIAVVVTDLWMPGMVGTELLGEVAQRFPDAVRVLLTAHADLDTAITAINEGHIFRFLVKPCPADHLRSTVRDAVERHRVSMAERQVLDSTLRASLQAIFDCLELANPPAFARAGRIRNLVSTLCAELGLVNPWQIEVAAMACQLGAVTLPPQVLTKLDDGRPLTEEEQQMLDALPGIAEQLLHRIPRLDDVVAIIRGLGTQQPQGPQVPPVVATGIELIAAATAFETFHARGVPPGSAVAALESSGMCGERVLAAFRRIHGPAAVPEEVRTVRTVDLRVGMRVVEDLRTEQGLVLIGRGMVVTEVMLDRLTNFTRARTKVEPVLAAIPHDEREPIRKRLVELLDGGGSEDVAFAQHLVAAFLATAKDAMEQLRAAVASADPTAVAYRAHALHGAAANVGASRIADVTTVIEQLAQAGRLTGAARQLGRLAVAIDQAPLEFAAAFDQVLGHDQHNSTRAG